MQAATGLGGLSGLVPVGGRVITDSFNRANSSSTLGSADTGELWTAHAGTWGISSNRAYVAAASGGVDLATLNANTANGTVGVRLYGYYPFARLVFRFSDVNNYLYYTDAAGIHTVRKVVGGTDSLVGTLAAFTYTDGDLIQVALNGSSIAVLATGVQRWSGTEAHNVTATRFGLGNNNPSPMTWDDFGFTG